MGAIGHRNAAGETTRRAILDAAAELVVERGWSAVSTRLVAERAGVGAGVVHYHFASIRELLTEATTARLHELVGALLTLVTDDDRPLGDALDELCSAIAEARPDDELAVLLSEVTLMATRDADVRRALAPVVARMREHFARRLVDEGRSAADATAAAALIAAALDGIGLHRSIDDAFPARDAARLLIDRVLGDR